MNSISVKNLHDYYSKLINFNIIHGLMWVIFMQNCVNFILLKKKKYIYIYR